MADTSAVIARIGVTRLGGQIGAELPGVDTGRPVSDDAVAQIRQVLLDHKVVFLVTSAWITRRRWPSIGPAR
jgi:alpha-ketoglutarate-dependent sulfate ester dioxygenase